MGRGFNGSLLLWWHVSSYASDVRFRRPFCYSFVSLALALITAGCGRVEPRSDDEPDGPTSSGSVVPLGRPLATMDPAVFRDHLQAILEGDKAPPSDFHTTLNTFPATRLWSMLEWLDTAEGDEGMRQGLAVVILSSLAEKAPEDAVQYLIASESPFGLSRSEAALMAFRRAMAQWSSQNPEEAIAALAAYQEDPALAERISALTEMHSERLEVTLAGAMPVRDFKAVTERWNTLERKEAGSLLPRFLERLREHAQNRERPIRQKRIEMSSDVSITERKRPLKEFLQRPRKFVIGCFASTRAATKRD